jgi:SAM-dependent methyltransferase
MKNIVNAKPSAELHGRTLYNAFFVDDSDIISKVILDIGCGYGWFELNSLKRNCNKVIGLELSEKDLQTAKDNIHDGKIEFVIGSAIDLPFEDNLFDTIVSWEVIEHIPKGAENKMFAEVGRTLKDGGTFYLSTPYDNFFSDVFDPAWWLIGHRHYKKESLISLAESSGFKAEKIVLNGGIWEILGINNLYIAKWVFRRAPFFERFFNEKQDKEYEKETGFTNIFIKFTKNPQNKAAAAA